jgi:DNA-binding LacI/PurR family transcriptional regulator
MTTIYDIARMAGVSVATVSRHLNGTATVLPETASRIQQAIDETGFAPNRAASSLTTKRTGLIGFLTDDMINPFTAEVAQAMTEEAGELGFSLLTAITGGREDRFLQMLTELRRHQVDGVVVTPPPTQRALAAVTELIAGGTPLTTLGVDLSDAGAAFVSVDTYSGAFTAVQHLIDLGHRRIGFIGGPNPMIGRGRLDGYTEALRSASIPVDQRLIVGDTLDREGGARALERLIATSRPPTAVFAINDVMALGAMQVAHGRRIRIPDDMSVVGFDDIAMASYASPALTTVAQPKALLGRIAARFVVAQLLDRTTPEPLRLASELIVRASTASPPT